jgi:hypothetical protein
VRLQSANALFAAATARATSAAEARGAVSRRSSVAGLRTSKTRPSAASVQALSIHIFVGDI